MATDLIAGEPVWWTSGDPLDVLSASASIARPVLRRSISMAGFTSTAACPARCPTQRALDLGASRVWVLNVARDFHGKPDAKMSAVDVLLESFAISRSHLGRNVPTAGVDGQKIVTLPVMSVGRHDLRDFLQDVPRLIAAGREAGRAMVAGELRARVRQPLSDARARRHRGARVAPMKAV